MKRFICITSILFVFSLLLQAQGGNEPSYKQMYVLYEGDTILYVQLHSVHIFPPLKFKNVKERQEYSKLVRDVWITYPYARMVANSILETYEYMETLPNEKAKQKHLSQVQKFMMDEYKPKLKKLNRTQAQILVKLIDRECNTSSYNIVKALVGSFKAGVYNVFAGMFGNSLKSKYEPTGKDRKIEVIVLQIEDETIDWYYSTVM